MYIPPWLLNIKHNQLLLLLRHAPVVYITFWVRTFGSGLIFEKARHIKHIYSHLFMPLMCNFYYLTVLMLAVPGKSGLRIPRHTSPASTRGPWTMKFIFSLLHPSTVSFWRGWACECIRTFLCMSIFRVVWRWAYPALCVWTPSQSYWQRSHSEDSDITLFILLLFLLCLSALTPPPPLPVYFLLSPLICLTDIRKGDVQCNVPVLTLDWINTCTGFTLPSTQINYNLLKMFGISS